MSVQLLVKLGLPYHIVMRLVDIASIYLSRVYPSYLSNAVGYSGYLARVLLSSVVLRVQPIFVPTAECQGLQEIGLDAPNERNKSPRAPHLT